MPDLPDKPTAAEPEANDAASSTGSGRQDPQGEAGQRPESTDRTKTPADNVNHNDPDQAIKDHMRFGEQDEKPKAEDDTPAAGEQAPDSTDKPEDPDKPDDPEKSDEKAGADQDPGAKKPRSKRRLGFILLGIGGFFVLLLLVGILPRIQKARARKKAAGAMLIAKPVVQVLAAKKGPDTTRVELPANTRANRETYLFARTDGYVEAWYADIGARVREGQLLALIATPELDQRVTEARANQELARSSYNRLRSIELPGAISRQELDQGRAQYDAQRAILNQLLAQRSFRRVTAPFSGIVTERGVEVGALVSTSNAEGSQLFKLEQTDTLRAFVNVPQNYVPSIRPGLLADFIVPEFPDRPFPGRVSRNSGALATDTRTLLTEVKIPNPKDELKPGIFALVRFQLPQANPGVIISANALVPSGLESKVVVVRNKKVYFQTIEPGRDFGDQIEVSKGLRGGELLVINPSEALRDGLAVEVRQAESGKDEKKGQGEDKDKPKGPEPLYDPDRPRVSLPVDEPRPPAATSKSSEAQKPATKP
ncbi:efflux RND transporter periplasmic adaptor subunit [Hymenobacter canadensis]|uniref:Efflux RND transporter periplasmic adaptor subunit n=1 Tax=Hymenobacter canadensis TaxID=2999067 RepID=A0ABY7LUD8_9BACT|nr:efflux RND transporter periplasmic adaptor subunit [Hymenobacter canadensis]WBA44014.1 efflux RND transporter periplasmic adaptor subunit [Hymenobacter canadensis]